jgi:hypothetical protein
VQCASRQLQLDHLNAYGLGWQSIALTKTWAQLWCPDQMPLTPNTRLESVNWIIRQNGQYCPGNGQAYGSGNTAMAAFISCPPPDQYPQGADGTKRSDAWHIARGLYSADRVIGSVTAYHTAH